MQFPKILRRTRDKNLAAVIKEYYGNNSMLFAQSYATYMYDIPEVRIAIEAVADIFSTIPIWHKRVDKDGNVTYLEDATSRVLRIKPNPLQNTSQFLKTVITQLLYNGKTVCEPIFAPNAELQHIFPLPSRDFEIELRDNDTATIQFYDVPSKAGVKYNLDNFVYLSRFCTATGSARCNLGLYQTVVQQLAQQALNVANPKKVRALLQGTSGAMGQLKEKDRKGTMKEVNASFDENVNGLAYLDKVWNITPINWQENDVNRDLIKFIVNIVYNYFKINDNIINYKASEIEMEMFINTSIKPIAQQLEQELTAKLFTRREIEMGHRIELDVFALTISTLQAKTNLFNVASRQGVLNIDEMREYIGQPPIPGGYGKMYRVTADTVDITQVNDYQAAKAAAKGGND